MKINCIENLESAWLAADAWRELAVRNPLLSPEWLLSWWKYYGEGARLMVLECRDDSGEVVGIAPFYQRVQFGSVSIHALGSGSVCTDYMQLLAKDGLAGPVAASVTEYLADYFKRQCSTSLGNVTIEAVENDSATMATLVESVRRQGYQHWLQPLMSTFRIELPRSMTDYVQNLGASAKRKGKKLLSRIGAQPLAYHQTVGKEQIRERLQVLQKLHQARRAVLDQSGCFSDDRFRDFLFEAVELLAARGQSRIDWYEIDEGTIATHLVLKGPDTLFIYQAGIDPAYMVHEPGHLLTLSTIQDAIEKRYRYYDLMRGDERYKAYWGAKPVPLSTLHCRPPHWLSQLAGASQFQLWRLKQGAKKLLEVSRSIGKLSVLRSPVKAS